MRGRATHPTFHLLQDVRQVSNNDGICNTHFRDRAPPTALASPPPPPPTPHPSQAKALHDCRPHALIYTLQSSNLRLGLGRGNGNSFILLGASFIGTALAKTSNDEPLTFSAISNSVPRPALLTSCCCSRRKVVLPSLYGWLAKVVYRFARTCLSVCHVGRPAIVLRV